MRDDVGYSVDLTLKQYLESASGPGLTGGIELSGDESAAFLDAAQG